MEVGFGKTPPVFFFLQNSHIFPFFFLVTSLMTLIITQWLVMPRWHWLWVHPTTSPLHTSDLNPANLSWHQSLLVSSQFPHLLSYQLLYCAHLFSNLNLLRHMYLFVDPLHHTANESTSESNPLHLALTWFVRGTETSFPNIAEYSRPPVPKLPSNLCLAHASLPYGALNLFISLKEKVKGRLNIEIFGTYHLDFGYMHQNHCIVGVIIYNHHTIIAGEDIFKKKICLQIFFDKIAHCILHCKRVKSSSRLRSQLWAKPKFSLWFVGKIPGKELLMIAEF